MYIFKLPLYLYLNIDLEAVKRLVNLPDTSNLTPLTTFCFIKLRKLFLLILFIFYHLLKVNVYMVILPLIKPFLIPLIVYFSIS